MMKNCTPCACASFICAETAIRVDKLRGELRDWDSPVTLARAKKNMFLKILGISFSAFQYQPP